MRDPFYNLDAEQYGARPERPERTDLWCACGTGWRACAEAGGGCCDKCRHDRPLAALAAVDA